MRRRSGADHHNYQHGHAADGLSRTYRAWWAMKQRCSNPKNNRYALYGGRGISVCERWLHSFENFLADVGEAPSSEFSLDRYPNQDGHYEPGNVRWATRQDQSRNKRSNVLITLDGETKCLTDWCTKKGIPFPVARKRRVRGWPDEYLFIPELPYGQTLKQYLNQTQTRDE